MYLSTIAPLIIVFLSRTNTHPLTVRDGSGEGEGDVDPSRSLSVLVDGNKRFREDMANSENPNVRTAGWGGDTPRCRVSNPSTITIFFGMGRSSTTSLRTGNTLRSCSLDARTFLDIDIDIVFLPVVFI